LIHETNGGVDHPLRAEAFAMLDGDDRAGTWHLVLATILAMSTQHVRQLGVHREGYCIIWRLPRLSRLTRMTDNWDDVVAAYEAAEGVIERQSLADTSSRLLTTPAA
jgi:hypothetical protein